MFRSVLFLCVCWLYSAPMHAQSFWFGVKGGMAMNNQSWGSGSASLGINRSALFTMNGDIFAETLDEDKKGALYAQLGYHTRGSALRYFSVLSDFRSNVKYKFNNIVLELGAKKSLDLIPGMNAYFILGVRGEYTVGSNLDAITRTNIGELVSPDYIRNLNYGVTFGGGFEKEVSELSNVFIEFSIQPDLSFQYEQFPIDNIRNPWIPNERVDLPLTQVRNLSIEAKVGIKFLRKVIYLD
ncbi:MAG: hypothetical protein LC107_13335 [Chitinophagales bacterium]|nr:hypothetical protein [Chitinophagales bacterium]